MRVGVKCADLFSESDASSLVGEAVKLRLDESSSPVGITDIAARQRGILACTWGGTDQKDGFYNESLTVTVVPDASAEFATDFPKTDTATDPTATNTAGSQSAYGCYTGIDPLLCVADMLAGSDWVTVQLQNQRGTVLSRAAESQKVQQVLTSVATSLSRATALAPWVPPPGPALGFCTSPTNLDQVRSAVKSSDFISAPPELGAADARTLAQFEDTFAQCEWGLPTFTSGGPGQLAYLLVSMLRGGAWALPAMTQSPPTDWQFGQYAPISIPGTTSAILACNPTDCAAIVAIGSTAVEIEVGNAGTAQVTAALTAMVGSIASS